MSGQLPSPEGKQSWCACWRGFCSLRGALIALKGTIVLAALLLMMGLLISKVMDDKKGNSTLISSVDDAWCSMFLVFDGIGTRHVACDSKMSVDVTAPVDIKARASMSFVGGDSTPKCCKGVTCPTVREVLKHNGPVAMRKTERAWHLGGYGHPDLTNKHVVHDLFQWPCNRSHRCWQDHFMNWTHRWLHKPEDDSVALETRYNIHKYKKVQRLRQHPLYDGWVHEGAFYPACTLGENPWDKPGSESRSLRHDPGFAAKRPYSGDEYEFTFFFCDPFGMPGEHSAFSVSVANRDVEQVGFNIKRLLEYTQYDRLRDLAQRMEGDNSFELLLWNEAANVPVVPPSCTADGKRGKFKRTLRSRARENVMMLFTLCAWAILKICSLNPRAARDFTEDSARIMLQEPRDKLILAGMEWLVFSVFPNSLFSPYAALNVFNMHMVEYPIHPWWQSCSIVVNTLLAILVIVSRVRIVGVGKIESWSSVMNDFKYTSVGFLLLIFCGLVLFIWRLTGNIYVFLGVSVNLNLSFDFNYWLQTGFEFFRLFIVLLAVLEFITFLSNLQSVLKILKHGATMAAGEIGEEIGRRVEAEGSQEPAQSDAS